MAPGRSRSAALALLAAAAALPLASAACGIAAGLPAGAEYIPPDTAFVLAMNLEALASTDLYKELAQRGGAVGLNRLNFFQFAKATGLDPSRDVEWLTFVGRGQTEEGPPIDQLSALVRGSFDGKKVYDFLKDSGLPFETHAGLDIFQVVIVEDRCRLCVAVLDDATAAFGDGETLRSRGEAREGAAPGLTGDATAARILSRVDRNAAIWGLARGRQLAGALGGFLGKMAEQTKEISAFASIEDIAFFVTADETILLAADAMARNEEEALLIADILEGAGAMGKLALKQTGAEASRLLAGFDVQVDGELVRASTTFPQSALVEIAQSAMADMFPFGPMTPFSAGVPGGEQGEDPAPPGEDEAPPQGEEPREDSPD